MNPNSPRLKHEQQALTTEQQSAQQQPGLEFASVEEMLRHDAAQTPVPPVIAERLQQSLGQMPKPPRSWWQKVLRSK